MELLNELTSNWEIASLTEEMDIVLAEYKELILFTQLNEGVLDDLGDEIGQRAAEIQRRIDVITKARDIVANLQKNGELTPEQIKWHKNNLTKNRKSLSSALKRTSSKMKAFKKAAAKAVKQAKSDKPSKSPVVDTPVANPADDPVDGGRDVDLANELSQLHKLAPITLSRIKSGSIDPNNVDMDDNNYEAKMDAIEALEDGGYLAMNGKLTDKGEATVTAIRGKQRTRSSINRSSDPISALADMGDDDEMDGDSRLNKLNFN